MASKDNETVLPVRLVIVNREDVDRQLSSISKDRRIGGGGGKGGTPVRGGTGGGAGGGPVPIRGRSTGSGGNITAGVVEGSASVATQGAIRGTAASGAAGGIRGGLAKLGGGSALAGAGVAGAALFAINDTKKSLRNILSGLTSSLDPNQTRAQRQLNAARTLPIIGRAPQFVQDIADAGFGTQLRTEGATAGAISSRLRGAFEGIGLANPDATNQELKALIQKQLGSDIREFGKFEGAKARGLEAGKQEVFDKTGKPLDVEAAEQDIKGALNRFVKDFSEVLNGAKQSDTGKGASDVAGETTINTILRLIGPSGIIVKAGRTR